MPRSKKPKKIVADTTLEDIGAHPNLVGFFEILLKVDQRLNPQNYGMDTIDQNGREVTSRGL